jgi:NAD-dependent deacetylase
MFVISGNKSESNSKHLARAVSTFKDARKAAALTGAGISVGSGIPDSRSPGGLWSVVSPEVYVRY